MGKEPPRPREPVLDADGDKAMKQVRSRYEASCLVRLERRQAAIDGLRAADARSEPLRNADE